MNQFNDFKNEESFPSGEALHSVSEVSNHSRQHDLQESAQLSKETVVNPQDPAAVKFLIQQVLTELLPYIASHGGHVELIDVRDAVVFIKFSGACVQCPLSFYTVTYGIERHIKVKIPWILRVEVVED